MTTKTLLALSLLSTFAFGCADVATPKSSFDACSPLPLDAELRPHREVAVVPQEHRPHRDVGVVRATCVEEETCFRAMKRHAENIGLDGLHFASCQGPRARSAGAAGDEHRSLAGMGTGNQGPSCAAQGYVLTE